MRPYRVALLLLAVCATACSAVAQKIGTARDVRAAMQPGHTYQSFFSRNDAMAPTIRAHDDTVLVDQTAYDAAAPQRGDIIVFMPPVFSQQVIIKRIIALPGDKLAIRHGSILVNGRRWTAPTPQKPDYTVELAGYRLLVDGEPLEPGYADIPPRTRWTAPDRLPRGCWFVLGDNVNNSADSHMWGCTELRGAFSSGPKKGKSTQLVGKVVKIFPAIIRR